MDKMSSIQSLGEKFNFRNNKLFASATISEKKRDYLKGQFKAIRSESQNIQQIQSFLKDDIEKNNLNEDGSLVPTRKFNSSSILHIQK